MSGASSNTTSLAILNFLQADDYIFHSILALVVYEYLITINQEISLVWRRQWSLSVWVFIANRYLLLLNALSEAMPIGSFIGCRAAVVITIASYAAQFLVFGVFSALRVYALWYPNTLLAYIVLGLNLVPIVTNIISYSYAPITYTDSVCLQSNTLSAGVNLRLELATRIGLISADILVLTLIWMKTYRNYKNELKVGLRIKTHSLLLRDGTMYFIPLLLMNIAQILLSIPPSIASYSPMPTIINPLTSILISRALLNLWESGKYDSQSSISHLSAIPTPSGPASHTTDHTLNASGHEGRSITLENTITTTSEDNANVSSEGLSVC